MILYGLIILTFDTLSVKTNTDGADVPHMRPVHRNPYWPIQPRLEVMHVMVIGRGVTSTELARQLVLEGNAMTEPETLLEGCRGGKPFHTMRPKDYLATHATVPTSVAVKRVTSGSVEYEDADGARHTVGVGHVTVCAGRRKVGLDLCGALVDAD